MVEAAPVPAPRWSVLAPVAPRERASSLPPGTWHALNISETGMFVSGLPLLQPGSTLGFEVLLPGGSCPPLELDGHMEVVWTRGEEAATPMLPSGMGVRFVRLDEHRRPDFHAYLAELARAQTRSRPRWPLLATRTSLIAAREAASGERGRGRAGLTAAGERGRAGAGLPPGLDAIAEAMLAATPVPAPVAIGATRVEAAAAPVVLVQPPAEPVLLERVLLEPPAGRRSLAGAPTTSSLRRRRRAEPGMRLGSYELGERLGTGGMGEVFAARHVLLGRRVAVKVLHPEQVHDTSALRRFVDEARLINQIAHENVVEVTDLVLQEELVFIVMELLAGRTLGNVLATEGALALDRAARIGVQLARGLDAVHGAGIVHRDLKPANVMLVARGANPEHVKLLDFGIALLRDQLRGELPPGEDILGTAGYISPEQLVGGTVDHRADIYALGVVLFAMLTGRLPFEADNPAAMLVRQVEERVLPPSAFASSDVPRALDDLVVRCLAMDPAGRPASAAAVEAQLREHAG